MDTEQIQTVSGNQYGTRLSSRVLEEHIQEMIDQGERRLKIEATQTPIVYKDIFYY